MGDVTNPNLKLAYTGQHSVYRADYQDEQGNDWWIEMVGNPKLIRSILERSAIDIQAVSITQAEFDAAKEAARTHGPQANPLDTPRARVPELIGMFHLAKLVVPKPLKVSYVIDPLITSDGNQPWHFSLGPGDTVANVRPTASRGDVAVALNGEGMENWASGSGQIASINAQAGSATLWVATVVWKNGDPAEYTLRGDINIG